MQQLISDSMVCLNGPAHSSSNQAVRIGCVQGGDYWNAKTRLESGGKEFYGGQRYSVEAYERFVKDHPNLVVSLDAPRYSRQQGQVSYCSVRKSVVTRIIPGRVAEWWRARQIIGELERFGTTHLIIRVNDLVGCQLLKWAIARNVPTAGILASRFGPEHHWSRRFCELGNAPNILFFANHNRVATESMVECGLLPDKAIAWDYSPSVTPADWAPKQLTAGEVPTVLFAGRVCEEKGIVELITACALARTWGSALRLVICGDGPLLPKVRLHAGVQEGWLECKGLVQNEQVRKLMRESTVTVVPSRHDFAEGLPLVIYESLAMRSPVILSDHPIFVRYFHDDFGMLFFRGADPIALSEQLAALLGNAAAYARLSRETEAVWQSLNCPFKFADVLETLRKRWGMCPADTAALAAD